MGAAACGGIADCKLAMVLEWLMGRRWQLAFRNDHQLGDPHAGTARIASLADHKLSSLAHEVIQARSVLQNTVEGAGRHCCWPLPWARFKSPNFKRAAAALAALVTRGFRHKPAQQSGETQTGTVATATASRRCVRAVKEPDARLVAREPRAPVLLEKTPKVSTHLGDVQYRPACM